MTKVQNATMGEVFQLFKADALFDKQQPLSLRTIRRCLR